MWALSSNDYRLLLSHRARRHTRMWSARLAPTAAAVVVPDGVEDVALVEGGGGGGAAGRDSSSARTSLSRQAWDAAAASVVEVAPAPAHSNHRPQPPRRCPRRQPPLPHVALGAPAVPGGDHPQALRQVPTQGACARAAAPSRALTTPHGPNQKPAIAAGPVSGTESDSDSGLLPEAAAASGPSSSVLLVGSPSQPPPLSSIAEQRSHSEGESEDDEDDEDGGWRVEDVSRKARGSLDETVLKTGYLWKKGERRKVRYVRAVMICTR